MAYAQRNIDVTFSLGKGSFGEGGFNTVTLSGLRVSATVEKTGLPGMNMAQIRVYGMTLSMMNQLSTLGKPSKTFTRDNQVTLKAGDAISGMAVVFVGTIQDAWADMRGAPDASFVAVAHTGLLAQMRSVPPSSYPGSSDAAVILAGLAEQMGMSFENNGVSVMLSNPYFPGTARMQAVSCAKAAGINMTLDDDVLAIWPAGGHRGGTVPLISQDTGLVGFPAYAGGQQMALSTLYNPSIRFGGEVNVQTSLTGANGRWTVNSIHHHLESQMPGGAWFTEIQGYQFGLAPSLPTNGP